MTMTFPPRPPIETNGVPPALFAHVVLQTARVDEMKDWYCTVLSAHVVHEGHGLCFLTYDDEHHRIAFLSSPGLERADREWAGVHHVAYSFAELGQLLSTYRHLKAKGILPSRSINHGPTTSLYYRDPDGNRVEMQVDNFSSKEEAARYFYSDEFERNPVGVQFDPENLIRDYEAGVPLVDLLRRPPLPPGATLGDMRTERQGDGR
ncbi:MAG: VOC family protein [Burkholderiaceae bacterium]